MKSSEEDILQNKCIMWFDKTYPDHRQMLFHVDNNSYNAIIGAKKAAMGVRRGVSDLIFIVDHVFFLEMKTPRGKQEPEQETFMYKVQERGHPYVVIRSLEEFQKFINYRISLWKINTGR